MIKEYFKIALKNLKKQRKRTLLTIIGIFIGIATLVALISIGQGLQNVISEQFEMMGRDTIMITTKGGFFGIGVSNVLTQDDTDFVKKISGVKAAGSFLTKAARVEYKNEVKYLWISGIALDESKEIVENFQSFKIIDGRELKKNDKYKAIAAIYFPRGKVFSKKVEIGNKLLIQNKEFEIVGILDEIGNPDDDSQLIIPLDSAREVFEEPEETTIILVKVDETLNAEEVSEKIKKELREKRSLKEGEEDFIVQTTEQIREIFQTVFNIVTIVLIAIAAISLIVGGIGIMNTMYTSVLERTREIGIMKAIGAKNSEIMLIFLIESGMLGLMGGVVGIGVGIFFAKIVEFVAAYAGISLLKTFFPWYLIIGALLFSFFVGALSGVMPARQAASLKPVDALRYE